MCLKEATLNDHNFLNYGSLFKVHKMTEIFKPPLCEYVHKTGIKI